MRARAWFGVMYARGLGDVCAAWVLYARAVEGRAAVGAARYGVERVKMRF